MLTDFLFYDCAAPLIPNPVTIVQRKFDLKDICLTLFLYLLFWSLSFVFLFINPYISIVLFSVCLKVVFPV